MTVSTDIFDNIIVNITFFRLVEDGNKNATSLYTMLESNNSLKKFFYIHQEVFKLGDRKKRQMVVHLQKRTKLFKSFLMSGSSYFETSFWMLKVEAAKKNYPNTQSVTLEGHILQE